MIIKCIYCEKEIEAPENLIGSEQDCIYCQRRIKIPGKKKLLINCRSCLGVCSENAKTCPHCGLSSPKEEQGVVDFMLISLHFLLIIILFASLISYISGYAKYNEWLVKVGPISFSLIGATLVLIKVFNHFKR